MWIERERGTDLPSVKQMIKLQFVECPGQCELNGLLYPWLGTIKLCFLLPAMLDVADAIEAS